MTDQTQNNQKPTLVALDIAKKSHDAMIAYPNGKTVSLKVPNHLDGDALAAAFFVEGEATCVSGAEYESQLASSMVVRSAGADCMAYVSSGSEEGGTAFFSETNPVGTYYVQSAVFRNFVYNASNAGADQSYVCFEGSNGVRTVSGPQSIPSMSVYGLIALALVLLTFAGRRMLAL